MTDFTLKKKIVLCNSLKKLLGTSHKFKNQKLNLILSVRLGWGKGLRNIQIHILIFWKKIML